MATPPVPDTPLTMVRFPRRLRGYDPDAVGAFVRHVKTQLDKATSENERLTSQVLDLKSRLGDFEDRGQALQDAMVTAEELRRQAMGAAGEEAEQMRQEASEEAEQMRQEASEEATRMLEEANAELARVRGEVDEARAEAERLKEEAAAEAQAIEDGARERAEERAAEIEGEARAEAERLSEEARGHLSELTSQIERLEQRKSEFLEYVARELDESDGNGAGQAESVDLGPLDARFRNGVETAEETPG